VAQMTKRLPQRLTVSAIALLFGTAAQGSYYPGHMDPGGTLTVPGFNGNAVFQIDSSCVPAGFTGYEPTNQNSGVGFSGCGSASVYSANVLLYSKALSDPPTPGVVLDSFTLGTSDTHGLDVGNPHIFDVTGVYVLNGALDGVDTFAMGSVHGSSTYSADNFWLQFVSGFCPDDTGASCPGLGPDASAFVSYQPANSNSIYTSNPAVVTFGGPCSSPTNCSVSVPEPGTLGLILGALGGGWLARRRRGAAAVKSE
jgi:hypothetical protein